MLVSPLRKDGYVDYRAALNAKYSQGVTPENNVVVLIWQVLGPEKISAPYRDHYFKLLGVSPPADSKNYLISPVGAATKGIITEWDSEKVLERPWTKDQFPQVALWLAANDKLLDRLAEAALREHYYSPLVGPDEGPRVMSSLLFAAQEARSLGRYFSARGMMRLGSGQMSEAMRDALTLHRLGRLVGQGPTLVESLVSMTLDGMGYRVDIAIAASNKLSVEEDRRFAEELRQLPPLPDLAEKINTSERYSILDGICSLAEGRKPRSDEKGAVEKFISGIIEDTYLDWNLTLRLGNDWMDRSAAVVNKPTCRERRQAEAEWDVALRKIVAEAESSGLTSLNPSVKRDAIAKKVVGLLLPAVGRASIARDLAAQRMDLAQLAFGLAAFRLDQGKYPTRLSQLLPKYVAVVPRDLFSEGELHYKPEADGYLLYSVGPDGTDEAGRNEYNIVVRMPLPAK